jgi:aspartate aminotransferase
MPESFFGAVSAAPPNAIFHTKTLFKRDTDPRKVNLGVGAYRTDEGRPWVLPTVLTAEKRILGGLEDGSLDHEYLPITGLEDFILAAAELAFGADARAIAEGRHCGVQALSGTGALRMGAEFLQSYLPCADGYARTVYVSTPTWGNHATVFRAAGMAVREHRYYKPETRGFDFEGMIEDLSRAKPGSAVLLHCCAHNPTGVDPTQEQWRAIRDVVKDRGLFPFFDSAYQGFASGDLDVDAFPMRLFEQAGLSMFVAQSFSKNFGLYNERAGCLQCIVGTSDEAKAVKSRLALIVRHMYSNPPNHGARIVATTLRSKELYGQWRQDIRIMSGRIQKMREALVAALRARQCPSPTQWRHITDQIGMFSYTGLTPAQVQFVQDKYHVYMLKSGRISMAGINTKNVEHIADAITDAVRSLPAASL